MVRSPGISVPGLSIADVVSFPAFDENALVPRRKAARILRARFLAKGSESIALLDAPRFGRVGHFNYSRFQRRKLVASLQ